MYRQNRANLRHAKTLLAGLLAACVTAELARAGEKWNCTIEGTHGTRTYSVANQELIQRGGQHFPIVRNDKDGVTGIVDYRMSSLGFVWIVIIDRKTGAYIENIFAIDGGQNKLTGKCYVANDTTPPNGRIAE
jgi:hypothetical protein